MDNDGKITNVELEMEPKLSALYINNNTAIKILRYLKEHYTIIPSYGNLKQYSYKGPMKLGKGQCKKNVIIKKCKNEK